MNWTLKHLLLGFIAVRLLAPLAVIHAAETATPPAASGAAINGFANAAAFGFSPEASGMDNTKALQRAVDQGGTIVVSRVRSKNSAQPQLPARIVLVAGCQRSFSGHLTGREPPQC